MKALPYLCNAYITQYYAPLLMKRNWQEARVFLLLQHFQVLVVFLLFP